MRDNQRRIPEAKKRVAQGDMRLRRSGECSLFTLPEVGGDGQCCPVISPLEKCVWLLQAMEGKRSLAED